MSNTHVATIGIDLGKNIFHVVGLDATGAIALRKKRSRNQLEQSLANISPCEAASKRLHSNVLVVALAAKLARMAWSMLAKGHDYDANFLGHAA